MKKTLLFITALALFAAVPLAGCGAKKDEETTSNFKNDRPVAAEDGAGSTTK